MVTYSSNSTIKVIRVEPKYSPKDQKAPRADPPRGSDKLEDLYITAINTNNRYAGDITLQAYLLTLYIIISVTCDRAYNNHI